MARLPAHPQPDRSAGVRPKRLGRSEDGPFLASPLVLTGISDTTISGQQFGDTETAIYLFDCHNVTVTGNHFLGVGNGVLATECTGITVEHNTFENILGPSGRFVQLDKVTGATIADNRGTCDPLLCATEDLISVYKSHDITVASNRLKGRGPSSSGSAIMLGDAGGSNIVCEDNILVNAGQVGIGVAGGAGVTVRRNKVFHAQDYPHDNANVGIYVWGQGDVSCSLIEVSDNEVTWFQSDGTENPKWDAGNCGSVTGWGTNNWSAGLDASIYDEP